MCAFVHRRKNNREYRIGVRIEGYRGCTVRGRLVDRERLKNWMASSRD